MLGECKMNSTSKIIRTKPLACNYNQDVFWLPYKTCSTENTILGPGAQMAEHLPSKSEALSSNPVPERERERE
jgi:hypothetical protein